MSRIEEEKRERKIDEGKDDATDWSGKSAQVEREAGKEKTEEQNKNKKKKKKESLVFFIFFSFSFSFLFVVLFFFLFLIRRGGMAFDVMGGCDASSLPHHSANLHTLGYTKNKKTKKNKSFQIDQRQTDRCSVE